MARRESERIHLSLSIVARTNGPMARDVDGLALLMRALLVPEMWRLDPLVPPMPFREDVGLV